MRQGLARVDSFQHAPAFACQHFSTAACQQVSIRVLADMLTSRLQGGVLKC